MLAKSAPIKAGLRALRFPLDALLVLSTFKDFQASLIVGNAVLNRWGLHVWRKRASHCVAAMYRRGSTWRLPAAQLAEFDANGCVRLGSFLSTNEFQALRAEICHGEWPLIEMLQPPAVTHRANLDAATCDRQFPALARLLRNPQLKNWVRYAAGCPGQPLVAIQRITSGPSDTDGSADPQTEWHMDTFHCVGKAWLYLHAVGPQDGPLAYVAGSHRPTPASLAWEKRQSISAAVHPNPMHARGSLRVTEAELDTLGFGAPQVLAVEANTLVIADTGGIHRRMPSALPTVRIEIYLSLRRNPFLAWAYPSLLGLPVVRTHWAGWAYAMYQWLVKIGRPGWIPRPRQLLGLDERAKLGPCKDLSSDLSP